MGKDIAEHWKAWYFIGALEPSRKLRDLVDTAREAGRARLALLIGEYKADGVYHTTAGVEGLIYATPPKEKPYWALKMYPMEDHDGKQVTVVTPDRRIIAGSQIKGVLNKLLEDDNIVAHLKPRQWLVKCANIQHVVVSAEGMKMTRAAFTNRRLCAVMCVETDAAGNVQEDPTKEDRWPKWLKQVKHSEYIAFVDEGADAPAYVDG